MVLAVFAVLGSLSGVGGLSSFFLFVTIVPVSIDVFCAEVVVLAVVFVSICCGKLKTVGVPCVKVTVFAGVLVVVSFPSVVAVCLFVTASFCCRFSGVLTCTVFCAAVLTFELASLMLLVSLLLLLLVTVSVTASGALVFSCWGGFLAGGVCCSVLSRRKCLLRWCHVWLVALVCPVLCRCTELVCLFSAC